MTTASTVVDIWYAPVPPSSDSDQLAVLGQLLTADEQAQEEQYHLPELRAQYRVTRALSRSVLARQARCEAHELQFEIGPHGKPRVCQPAACEAFNISHTRGAVLCATTSRGNVGVDVERLDRRVNLQLANRYFAPLELEQLLALDESERPHRFMELWTLKEAFIKALGTGLATPLDHFAFDFSDSDVQVHTYDKNVGPSSRWQFYRFELESNYLAAVAVLDGGDFDLTVRLHTWQMRSGERDSY